MKRNRKQSAQPPSGVCLDERNGNVVIADYAPDGGFEIHRVVVDERRAVNVTAAQLRTVVHNANAHSQFAQLSATAADSDETILSSLLGAGPPDSTQIANFTRCPDDRIVLTQADEDAVAKTCQTLRTWLELQQPTHVDRLPYTLRIETRTRAIARAWHATNGQPIDPDETIAFLVLSADDYAVGVWSVNTGLAYETEERFERGANTEIKCRGASEMFARLIGASTIENLNLPPVSKAIISAPDDYQDQLLDVLSRNRDLDNIEISPITLVADTQNPTPIDQPAALAIGALLDDPEVPPCDLNISLQEQLEDIRNDAAEREQAISQTRAMSAIAAALIPLVALAAFALSSYTYRVVERARLQARIAKEETISKRLAKDNADYESSKSNFAAFHSLLDNLIGLRQRQPATEQLLRDLNQRWPHDPSWFISEINVKGQSVEIKGKTRNEQAVTTFAKSLEFSDGLFTGILAKNNLQGASPNASAATQPPASNIIEFTVNATYTPLAGPSKPQSDSSGAQTQQTAAPQVPKAIPLISPPQAPRVPDNPPTLNAPAASPQLGASR